jgi:hypothetical protein
MMNAAMKRVRNAWAQAWPHVRAIATGVLLGGAIALLFGAALAVLRQWVFIGAATPWIETRWFGPHGDETWQAAIVLAGSFTWAIAQPWSRRRRARIVWGVVAIAIAIITILVIATEPPPDAMRVDGEPVGDVPLPWAFIVGMTGAGAGAAWLSRRPEPRTAGTRARWLPHPVVAAIAITTVMHVPSITDFIDARKPQSFPAFRVELVAATPALEGAPDATWVDGQWWLLHRDDTLVIDDASVARIRWVFDPATGREGLEMRFDAETVEAIRARSIRRFLQHDAFVVDGRVHMVPSIQSELLQGTFAIDAAEPHRQSLAELYTRLSGIAAPAQTQKRL